MNILVANERDIEELTQVEIESKKQSIPECIEEYEIDYPSRYSRWQTYFNRQSPQTSKPERLILKAINDDGRIIGYLAGHLTTRYNLDAEIQSFYVLKQMQKQKVGTGLLIEFVKWLINMNAKSLCVGLHPKNKYKSFYLKYNGQYLNEHWIFWQDITKLLPDGAGSNLPKGDFNQAS
jgi:GNAT superfamily N-acetyltransferase